MNHFEYRDGVLYAEGVPVPAIAEAVGTPFYCYSTATLERHYNVFSGAFDDIPSLVCYAMKANSNQAVIATLAALGCGADVVSGGELARALAAGVPPEKIMFSGVGKTADELDAGLAADILCFNVESVPELEMLSARAVAMGKTARVSLRINPDVDAGTLSKISTGRKGDKFGVPFDEAADLYDERFCRMWEFYLAGSEAFFRCMDGMVFQIQLAKRPATVPLTRDYIAAEEARLARAEPARYRLVA